MPKVIKDQENAVVIRFGGGLHTRASEDEIDAREAADGSNFLLDLDNRELRNRPPFDLIGTVPNAAEIRGGGSLLKGDGTVASFIQAGSVVYEWDGLTGFTPIGTVNSGAKLRGHWRKGNWTLDNKLLITDLALVDTIKEWDGTTFQSVTFTNEAAAPFGNFYAKYVSVSNERAVFSHVRDGSATTAHMIVGAKREDYTVISNNQRPASGLSAEDPFFLLSPDLRPINGHEEAFGTTVISTEKGQVFQLTGSDARDFAFDEFYAGSGAAGEEALTYVGNDIIYGRQGRVESLRDTDRFGESEADDLTAGISDRVSGYDEWRIVYNARLNRAYLFPTDASECWVLNNSMRGGQISAWMRWTTQHSLAFQPTFVMPMLDPIDGLEYTIMGDGSGNVYRLEGSGSDGDAGQSDIATEWLTKLFSAPLDAEAYELEGYIKYRKNVENEVTLIFEWTGKTAFNESTTLTLPGVTEVAYFGGDYYFGGEVYFGARFENRILRQHFDVPGQSSDLQLRVRHESVDDFRINEIGLRFKAASQ